jgi:excisionase family DNA binding protein
MVDNVLDYLERINCYLTVKEAAKILRKHRETIYRHIKDDGLPAIKDGRRWKIDSRALADWYRNWTARTLPSPRTSNESEPETAKSVVRPRMKFDTGRDRHQAVNAFIFYIYETTGKAITRRDIWKIRVLPSGETVGYKTKSDFCEWQRGAGSKTAARFFESVLTGKLKIF